MELKRPNTPIAPRYPLEYYNKEVRELNIKAIQGYLYIMTGPLYIYIAIKYNIYSLLKNNYLITINFIILFIVIYLILNSFKLISSNHGLLIYNNYIRIKKSDDTFKKEMLQYDIDYKIYKEKMIIYVRELNEYEDKLIQKTKDENDKKKKENDKKKKAIINKPIDNNINQNNDFINWKNEIINSLNNSISLSDLILLKPIDDIKYGDLLNCFEWKFKRLIILLRDKHKCNNCHSISKYNHVHHNYYLQDKLPWDIDNEALETLCSSCHKERHRNTSIPVYKINNGLKIEINRSKHNCERCGGIGYILKFSHVEDGICFLCRGDSLNYRVFYNILNKIYNNLNEYDDHTKRNEYTRYIMKLKYHEIINSIPDALNYLNQEDDDTPF